MPEAKAATAAAGTTSRACRAQKSTVQTIVRFNMSEALVSECGTRQISDKN
jgi:hypothetical protein